VEAVIFNGGYGYDYVKFAAGQVTKQSDFTGRHDQGVAVPRRSRSSFSRASSAATPPDLIDNSGEERHRVQRHRAGARGRSDDPSSKPTNYEGHEDLRHAVSEREAPGHLRRQVPRDETT